MAKRKARTATVTNGVKATVPKLDRNRDFTQVGVEKKGFLYLQDGHLYKYNGDYAGEAK